MTPRKWQYECCQIALETYTQGQKHMLVLAAPGAGKTFIAADLARQLFELDLIDLVLCFAPTQNVVNGIRKTFSKALNGNLDGNIKDVGDVFTYQGMLTINEDIWTLLNKFRVFVVLDEIHHCAGGDKQPNVWGQMIVNRIQNQAEYTLALTGTPWRSDFMPVALANYCNEQGRIKCDYTYGLNQAVADRVCRVPNIELLDHSGIINSTTGVAYNSLKAAMDEGEYSLKAFVTHPDFERETLKRSVDMLGEYQMTHKDAGGLVVASSVEHAERLLLMLENDLKQTAVLVSYREPNSSEIIDEYRYSHVDWIVSIGMVSEGTDIPRLRVTCMLTTIQTEMFFRQLLGRTQRLIEGFENSEGWLVALSTENLDAFSERLHLEVPSGGVIKTDLKKQNARNGGYLLDPNSIQPGAYDPVSINNISLHDEGFQAKLKPQKVEPRDNTDRLQSLSPKFVLQGSYSSRVKYFSNALYG